MRVTSKNLMNFSVRMKDAREDTDKLLRELESALNSLYYENENLRMNVIANPENFTCMDYNLKDLIVFAHKCEQCGVIDEDLKKCANDFSLAYDIIWREFDEAFKHPFYDWKTGTVSIKVGGKKDGSET